MTSNPILRSAARLHLRRLAKRWQKIERDLRIVLLAARQRVWNDSRLTVC